VDGETVALATADAMNVQPSMVPARVGRRECGQLEGALGSGHLGAATLQVVLSRERELGRSHAIVCQAVVAL
jgi:hypothetical protein